MEAWARPQGESLLVDNHLFFKWGLPGVITYNSSKKYHNEKHDIEEKEMLI